jgi:hypothetical protein
MLLDALLLCAQVAADEELGSVKEAMAVMSKQHYMDVKRYKDAATAAGTAATAATSAQQQQAQQLQLLQQQQAQQLQQIGSPKGLQHMIDTHPRHLPHVPRVSQDSACSFDRADKARRIDTTHDGSAEVTEEGPGSPVPAYKLQIQIHQLERQLAEQAAKTQEEVAKREVLVSVALQM